MHVTAVDTASYAYVFAKTGIELNRDDVDYLELLNEMEKLNNVTPEAGYFTETFCRQARYFQPHNGEKIDAVRNQIESDYKGSWLYEPLLASLILGADRVDSTTGVQMAYLKNWSARSRNQMSLVEPGLLPGSGRAMQADAAKVLDDLPEVDLAYLDPPYNQHRYFANYHIWETLVRWDEPDAYGVAKKRVDVRTDEHRSDFNSKPKMYGALSDVVSRLRAKTIILSYNNESWLSRAELLGLVSDRPAVEIIDVDFKRYIGSQIGVYNKQGERVGNPGAKRNTEQVLIAGETDVVAKMLLAAQKHG